jgi:NAD(P)-dependent dehydrogenase (short-subunit alcohol dehydrogenase family)
VTRQLFSLAGKKALVTGASRGIGQVIPVAFAKASATIVAAAIGRLGHLALGQIRLCIYAVMLVADSSGRRRPPSSRRSLRCAAPGRRVNFAYETTT